MGIGQCFKMAFKQLKSNKLRSALTMLGIIIGVMAITLLVSVGNSMNQSVMGQLGDLGSNILTVNSVSRDTNKQLDMSDVYDIEKIEGVDKITPVLNGNSKLIKDNRSYNASLIGTTENYDDVKGLEVEQGRFLEVLDIENSGKVAVIGLEVAYELFQYGNPIGEYINIEGIPFKVVGILEEKGQNSFNSNDTAVIIPLQSAQRLLKTTNLGSLSIAATDSDSISEVENKLKSKLNKIFDSEDDYSIMNQQQILDMMDDVSSTMTTVLGVISGISLVVGGIGIMNIMLVSVSERTKEIGIRKALGAKKKDILIQFLIESIIVSLLGGIIGASIGIAGSLIVSNLLGVETGILWSVVFAALGFSTAIGVIFGIIPANKASKLQPIQALKSE